MYGNSINYLTAGSASMNRDGRVFRAFGYAGSSLKSYGDCSMIEYLKESVSSLSLEIVEIKRKINDLSCSIVSDNDKLKISKMEDRLFELEELRSVKVCRLNGLIDRRTKSVGSGLEI